MFYRKSASPPWRSWAFASIVKRRRQERSPGLDRTLTRITRKAEAVSGEDEPVTRSSEQVAVSVALHGSPEMAVIAG